MIRNGVPDQIHENEQMCDVITGRGSVTSEHAWARLSKSEHAHWHVSDLLYYATSLLDVVSWRNFPSVTAIPQSDAPAVFPRAETTRNENHRVCSTSRLHKRHWELS